MEISTYNIQDLIVATRIHCMEGREPINLERSRQWVRAALEYAGHVIIAVDTEASTVIKPLEAEFDGALGVLLVHPWIGYTAPLNAIVQYVASLGKTRLLLQSAELSCKSLDILVMHKYLDQSTLVVGGAVCAEHGGTPGPKILDEFCAPWNTLALWNLEILRLTGFLAVSDGEYGGVEEVATISLLQRIRPGAANAMLLKNLTITWQADFSDEQRASYHARKMETKTLRAKYQLAKLGIEPGTGLVVEQ